MPPIWAAFLHDRDYKPGSVIDSHLSRHTVAGMLQPPSRKQPGKPCFLCGVAPDRVYSNGHFYAPLGELLPRLSILTASGGPLTAVFLCCTFPQIALGGRYPLSLPCGARTFLTAGLSASPRDCLSYSHNYFSPWRGACQRKMHCYFAVPALYYIMNLYVQTKG